MPKSINNEDPDSKLIKGFPEHGDEYTEDSVGDTSPDDQDQDQDQAQDQNQNQDISYAELKRMLDRQADEISQLRRMQAPPMPKDPVPASPVNPPSAESPEDFETRFFKNPKAVLQEFGQEVESRVTKQLRTEYQRDRGTQQFWDMFYEKHRDLKADHDLVDLTLNSNLGEMSSMPVDKAIDRLADLTRERILRYAGGAGKPRAPKPKVEGANPPAPARAKKEENEKPLSISGLIRQRRADRRKAISGV